MQRTSQPWFFVSLVTLAITTVASLWKTRVDDKKADAVAAEDTGSEDVNR